MKLQWIIYSHLSSSQKEQCLQLWNNEYPVEIHYSDMASFENYLNTLTDVTHLLLIDESQQLKGWYFDFKREEERWFGLVLDHRLQRQGWGTKLIRRAQEKYSLLYGWVIDRSTYKKASGELYQSPLAFYQKNGFNVIKGESLEKVQLSIVKISWQQAI